MRTQTPALVRLVLAAGVVLGTPAAAVRAQDFGASGGFNSGGFNSTGFNNARQGFNAAGFNAAPLPALGVFGGICARMLVPAASLALASRGFSATHAGIDLVAETGAPVRAAAAGVIAHLGQDADYGNFVDIRHPGGIATRYGHLSAFATGATAGATVLLGSLIGAVGSTGHSTGPHLHFEVRVSGTAVDPQPFLQGDNCPRGAPRQEILEARDISRRSVR